MISHSQDINMVDLLVIIKVKKFTPKFSEFTLMNFGYVTNGIRAQVATLGPLWAQHKSKGTSWMK